MPTTQEPVAQSIEKVLTAIGDHWFNLLVALVGVGIVTMALLQLLKELLPTRRWFQHWWLRYFWLYKHAKELKILRSDADKALEEMVILATAGDEKALFNLPVEQLIGQLNAAAQAILDRPEKHANLIRIFARRADPDDVRALLKGRPSSKATMNNYLESRNRVAQQIQRSLDAIQIAMGYRWQWIMQGLSVVISAAIIFLALTIYSGITFWEPRRVAYALIVAVLGGFVAPVARDLVAAIQSLRGRVK